MRVQAVTDHEISERAPIRVRPGDQVRVGERDTTWPAFVFVTTASGAGWVPERYLGEGRPTAEVRHAYDTQELPVATGEELVVVEDDPESGWSWCENAQGRAGWVPHAVLPKGTGA
ncbi:MULTISPECIES: SH3 domain-containing protein [unclassified Streptomyces]|uniref:SH3 domain-containing protein n=1 Tax=unclassified Streptomyces TaxID=2593676 RepID=UPI00278C29AD|nr:MULTISPECIES: SH3 domain-containing protein [unclassified Streptomyces]